MTPGPGRAHGGVDLLHVLFGGLGGHATVVGELSRELSRRGIRSAACLYAPPGQFLSNPGEWLGVETVALVEKRGRFDLPGARGIQEAVQEIGPRGVVWHAHFAPVRLGALRARGEISFMTMVEHQAVHLRTLPDQIRSVAALAAATSVIFLSQEYRESYPLIRIPLPSLSRAAVVPNGIDLSVYSPSTDRPGEGESMRVGMMGRMDGTKDFATLIRTVSLLRGHGGVPGLRVRLAGDGAHRARLQELAKEEGVEDAVEFLGVLGPQEVPGFLKELDLYVHLSAGETMSTALLQAYATGLPVVATRVRGITNLVRDGKDGVLVPFGDPGALARTIHELVAQPGRSIALGAAARVRAEEEFGADRMADRYLAHWAGLDPEGPWGG